MDCRTVHSFAYKYTVRPMKLFISFFGHSSIKERIDIVSKIILIDLINQFLLSKYLKIKDFIDSKKEQFENIQKVEKINIYDLFDKYIRQIISGSNGITHNGYVKLFHMMLSNNQITIPEYDLIAIDESADLSEVTLEIFQLLKAKKKIIAGDRSQAIYSFTHCVDGLSILSGSGTTCEITKTYRCSPKIAKQVQTFMRKHYDPTFNFPGTEPEDNKINSIMYLSRTNSMLVGQIIRLMEEGVTFQLLRDPKNIFELILILMNLKKNGKIFNIEWSHLQKDVNTYFSEPALQDDYDSALEYIAELYEDDIQIKSASSIIFQYGQSDIYAAYRYAKENKNTGSIKLNTIFNAKGDEADRVYILDDINTMVTKTLNKPEHKWSDKEYENLRLAYVAVTRAKKELIGADFLDL